MAWSVDALKSPDSDDAPRLELPPQRLDVGDAKPPEFLDHFVFSVDLDALIRRECHVVHAPELAYSFKGLAELLLLFLRVRARRLGGRRRRSRRPPREDGLEGLIRALEARGLRRRRREVLGQRVSRAERRLDGRHRPALDR